MQPGQTSNNFVQSRKTMNPNLPTGETMSNGDDSGSMEMEQETITLAPGQTGAISAKKGDKLTFCVTDKDDETGEVYGYFETKSPEPAKDEGPWAGLKEAMSETEPMEEA